MPPKKPLRPAPTTVPELPSADSSEKPSRSGRVPDKISRDLLRGPELPPEHHAHATGEEALEEIARATAMVTDHRARVQRMYAALTVSLLLVCAVTGGWLLILARRPREVAPQLRDDVSLAASKVVPLGEGERPRPVPLHPVADDGETEIDPAAPPSTTPGPVHHAGESEVLEIPAEGEPVVETPKVVAARPRPREVLTGTGAVNLQGKATTIILQGSKVVCPSLPCTLTLPAGPQSLVAMIGTTRVPVKLSVKPGETVTRMVHK